ncbi:helix-turn-helix domain-containing protein [Virgibacillus proomii]|uniref:helix-turn-helix domain-containing protein n=1 Tax=Virgibacillus proomii TaxID=84407 RepID=UPI00098745F7|nr:helix-turn-helix domain-containing protein [Virgibacillus proomii]
MNGMIINSNTENNERGLLPYPIIIAANKGEPEAMKVVVLHYGSYMTNLSMRKLRDEQGNTYWGIDEDTRERLRAKLMQSFLAFKI